MFCNTVPRPPSTWLLSVVLIMAILTGVKWRLGGSSSLHSETGWNGGHPEAGGGGVAGGE